MSWRNRIILEREPYMRRCFTRSFVFYKISDSKFFANADETFASIGPPRLRFPFWQKTRTQFPISRNHFFQGVRFLSPSPPAGVKYFHHVKQFLCLEEKRISRISMHPAVTFSCICLTPVCFRDTGGGGIQLFEISIILESYRPPYSCSP